MYRIFRGKHVLILAETEKEYKGSDIDFIFKKPTEDQIKDVLTLSKNSTKALKILLVDKPKKLRKQIYNEFKVVEAAGGLVFNDEGRILAIKRLGKWDLPKGKIKKHEDHEIGAMREVEEETGVSGLSILRHLDNSYHTYYRGGEWVLKKTYWFVMSCTDGENLVPQVEEDIEKVKWFKLSKFHTPERDTYPAIKWLLDLYIDELKTEE